MDTLLNILDALEVQINILRSTISLQRRCASPSDHAEPREPEVPRRPDQRLTVTPRQQEVITQLGQGLSNRQIARRLDISEATVKSHLYAAYRKLGVSSRSEAILEVLKQEE
ncbi:LuxR C-terminal-related transcriptional regulator [Amycolatopsis mediterranei]|uniref:response regulator transcription factor n=1 Tax=Amycolatopsis mediterranei TaxID=33910 RepID=UPI00344196E5